MSNEDDDHKISMLICGESGMGKTMSLKFLKNHEGVLYLNCEGGKDLPFKNKFVNITIDDPYEIFEYIEGIIDDEKNRFHTVIVDTISFMMNKFEQTHVIGSANTQEGWGKYGNFFPKLMFDYVSKCPANVIFLGHLDAQLDEATGETRYSVPVKGALKKNGLEAYFTTVVVAKKVKLKELSKYESSLINITEREKKLGFKHVFQTLTTKQTVGDRIRSPEDLFDDEDTYIDNNAQILIDELKKYYR